MKKEETKEKEEKKNQSGNEKESATDGSKKNNLKKKLESKLQGLMNRKGKDSEKIEKPEKTQESTTGEVKPVTGPKSEPAQAISKEPEKPDDKKPEEKQTGVPKEDKPAETPEEEKPPETEDENKKGDAEDEKNKEEKATTVKKPDTAIAKPAESMEELLSQKDEIETLLSSIEDSYREATLPDSTYKEVKIQNEKKLEEIEKKIKKLDSKIQKEVAVKEVEVSVKEPELKPEAPAPEPEAAEPEKETHPPGEMTLPAEKVPEEEVTVPDVGTEAESPAAATGPAGPAAETATTTAPPATVGDEIQLPGSIQGIEQKIEERLKNVIASASVEITDKKIGKVNEKLEMLVADVKDLKRTAQIVSGFDKQFTLMTAQVEKTKALVEGVKEAKNVMDEKVQHIIENFTEIRSMVYQREASAKEQEVVMDKLKDAVSQIDSARILREFTTRDEQLKDVNTRIERIERSSKVVSESMNKIKALLIDVGSLENVLKASKMVGEKLDAIQEIEGRMKASSSKLGSVYVEMKKKLDEFVAYKVKQDKLEGMTTDLMKNVEEFTRRMTDFVSKDELDMVKTLVAKAKEDAMAAAEKAGEEAVKTSLPPEIADLAEEKEEIETLLSTLEENLSNKEISEEEYNNAKSKNVQKMNEIEDKIKALKAGASKEGATDEGAGEPGTGGGKKHKKAMLLAKLREQYENGGISRSAYTKGKKLLMGK